VTKNKGQKEIQTEGEEKTKEINHELDDKAYIWQAKVARYLAYIVDGGLL
jgi:hypothetical protein